MPPRPSAAALDSCLVFLPSASLPVCRSQACLQRAARAPSSTIPTATKYRQSFSSCSRFNGKSKARREMISWIQGKGQTFVATSHSANYIGGGAEEEAQLERDLVKLYQRTQESPEQQAKREVEDTELIRKLEDAMEESNRLENEAERQAQNESDASAQASEGDANATTAADPASDATVSQALMKQEERASRRAAEDEQDLDLDSDFTEDSSALSRPFPHNPHFFSHPVLSEETKDLIFDFVKNKKRSIREASAHFHVDMNRVGAVIRLKGVEQEWEKQGRPLANSYSQAIMKMLPTTRWRPGIEHEPINDLTTHRATKEQIFYPASESRNFTRKDAGAIFEKGLLPAEDRVPHPELVQLQRDVLSAGQPGSDISDEVEAEDRLHDFYTRELRQRQSAADRRRARTERNTIMVQGPRATFRVTNVTVDESTVGRDGRGRHGVGVRYGVPPQDRKKGQVKIPTKWNVE